MRRQRAYKELLDAYLYSEVLFDFLKEKMPGQPEQLEQLGKRREELLSQLNAVKDSLGYLTAMPFMTDEQPFDGFDIKCHKVIGDRDKALSWASEHFWSYDEEDEYNLLYETAVFVLNYFDIRG